MIRPLMVLGATLTLTACGTTAREPEIRTVYVDRPVRMSCVPSNLPPPPSYRVGRSDLAAAPDAAERYRLAVVGFQERDARLNEVEPVVETCRD